MSATGATICLGLSGRKLKDKDLFSKSDPYVVISRPNMGGGFTNILISETKKVGQKIKKLFNTRIYMIRTTSYLRTVSKNKKLITRTAPT